MAAAAVNSDPVPSTSGNRDAQTEEDPALAGLLKEAIKKTINRSTLCLSRTLFAEAFPAVHKHDKKRLTELRKHKIALLQEYMEDEIEYVYGELNVEEKLNNLEEQLRNDNPTGKKWRPTGNVDADLRAHLMKKKQEHVEKLKDVLKKEKKHNRELQISHIKKKESLTKLVRHVNDKFEKYGVPTT